MGAPAKKLDIDIVDLRSRLHYDSATGKLFWRNGQEAGFIGNRGYVRIKFRSREWMAHVLIWAHVHGIIPTLSIDHINRDPADNRIANLRLVTPSENSANRSVCEKTVNGRRVPCGVHFNRREAKFKASFRQSGRRVHVGTFLSLDDAVRALETARS